ncbi:Potassium voltage-gated channel subfamily KQT [Mariniradius saccharolyticus AK6]|uniref:Potassium voltage-gated channel subfamily KQT n=1 Tax=Mariniradius saccharolyticus AK6 TaxID=1239962 RepID=M7Y6I8_9BACT|nr:ion transporter [Mariniradius saccharolyticus]EMS32841.1 Potassium voltage-gated channel subfamily KQT [Mariniradius saccharolyticus AK6]
MSLFPSKERLAHIVFEHSDKASRRFDITVLWLILLSVLVAILDSEPWLHARYKREFYFLEWAFTILFTIEYILRLYLSSRKLGYIFSFYGMVDLLAILPTYLSIFLANTQFLVVIRALRLLRVVRILKLGRYVKEAEILKSALRKSRAKIQIFIGTVLTIVLITGTLMFIVEGPESGFTSIGVSMYWAIVTLTTVGYGDITPITPIGKFLAAVIMLLGYAIIAVPTGIITSELTTSSKPTPDSGTKVCKTCKSRHLDADANYCKYCGERL